ETHAQSQQRQHQEDGEELALEQEPGGAPGVRNDVVEARLALLHADGLRTRGWRWRGCNGPGGTRGRPVVIGRRRARVQERSPGPRGPQKGVESGLAPAVNQEVHLPPFFVRRIRWIRISPERSRRSMPRSCCGCCSRRTRPVVSSSSITASGPSCSWMKAV